MRIPEWWPPADGEPIGEERARELVTWLRTVAPKAVVKAREYLVSRYPESEPHAYAVRASQLATLALGEGQRGLCIGSASVPAPSGRFDTVGIALQRDGRLALTFRSPDEAVQRWVPQSSESNRGVSPLELPTVVRSD